MLLRSITSFFSGSDYRDEAHRLYVAVVEQSRHPEFYLSYGVPDTVDGRFDMIAVHMFLASSRLKKDGSHEALELLRSLSEAFFSDMDRSLREMGSTDTGVGKRIKKMSQAFYGRMLAYQTAAGDAGRMQEALLRNLYRGDMAKLADARLMEAYIDMQRAFLGAQPVTQLLQGDIVFKN